MCALEVLLVNSVLVSGHLGCISRDLMWIHTHAPFENVFGVLSDIWSHAHSILYGHLCIMSDCVVVGNNSLHGVKNKCYACLWEPVDYHGATPTYQSLTMCVLVSVAVRSFSFADNSSC